MADPGACGQIEKFFESGYTLYRKTPGKDASGGLVNSWAKIKDIPGRLRTMGTGISNGLTMKNNKKTETHGYRFYCGIEDIRAGDEIRKGDERYEVKLPNDVMTFSRFMQIEMDLVEL